tara:strand:+ start:11321 stop:15001 length:3681 start_codon:yes stop_codon:yes gene_type:complete
MTSIKTKQSEATITTLKDKIPFHSLSPISDQENHKYYCDALEWALINRKEKDIKNIALTGNYGSGKSSILKSFRERQIKGLNFLNISLATFKEEKNVDSKTQISQESKVSANAQENKTSKITRNKKSGEVSDKNDQLRLIELSILQQIFYHEKSDNIPDSRFKKIRGLKPSEVKNATWLVFGVLCSFYLFFYFDTFRTLFNLPEPPTWLEFLLKGLVLSVFLTLFYHFLKKVIQFSQRLTISKLNFQNLEIQVAETLDKSILNNHLDEILYFFEATNYNVVIIEDLDRFEQTEIFTKLREINLLINNSKSIDREVAFIYAVRDEMFKDNDRTKFFDFIIPIIPVINYSNSNEQLTKALNEFGYSISTDLIDEVAFYVDDMRLLYNVVNEFHIYFQKFQGKKFMDKLFAMIVYKNIYPEDFVNLGRNSGILYKDLVENKKAWVKETIEEIENENLDLKSELDQLEKTLPRNLDELKRIYLLEYLKMANGLTTFRIGNVNYTTEKMLEEENFEKFLNNSVTFNRQFDPNQMFSIQFSQVEAQINPEQGYLERKAQIEQRNSGRVTTIRNKLKSNQEKIRNTKGTKIKYLIKDKKISVSPNPTKQEQLIILLIRNGYIAEDYLNYISYFYPGSITENDHWFLMNVRNETPSDFEYKLDEVGNVIKKISDSEFEKNYVLNYNLVDHLFEFRVNSTKKNITIKQLSNESVDSVKFVKSYIEKSKHVAVFIKELCKIWTNIWGFIEQDSSLSQAEKLSYYILILNNAELSDIKKLASISGLESFISNKPDYLTLIEDIEKLIAIIELFDIKFTSLNFDGISKDIKEYVYENNNYALNSSMLMLMIKTFGEFNQENFNNSNYAAIQLSKCDSLISYVDNHITEYIDSVYLKLENNKEEQLDYLVDLLNHAKTIETDKERILLWTNTTIKDISELETTSELIDFLLQNNKVEANWLNIIFAYEEKENTFSDSLLNFINDQKNAKTLSSNILNSKENNQPAFRRAFLLNNDINDELYSLYIDAFPFSYGELNYETLSKPKVTALVKKRKLSFNLDNYTKLKANFSSLHLTFAVNNISSFFKEFSVLNLSELEFIELLENSNLETSNKIKLIGLFETENTITEIKALTLIGNISLEHTALKLSEPTLSSILLKSSIKQNQKIELLVRNISVFNTDFIPTFLNSLGGDYKQLNEKGPMPSFKKTNSLVVFFDYLKKIGKISKIKDKGDWIKITTFRN